MLLKPQDGKPVAVPRLDMILGSYYLTMTIDGELGEGKYFKDPDEAIMAFQNKAVGIHAKIFVRVTKEIDGELKSKKIETSVGRIIFNQAIPQDLGFVNREEDPFQYEINFPVVKKTMGQITDREIKVHGVVESAEVIDYIKALGFKYSTLAGITFSVADVEVPEAKKGILLEAEKEVEKVRNQYRKKQQMM